MTKPDKFKNRSLSRPLARLVRRARLLMLVRGVAATLAVAVLAALAVMAVDAAVVLTSPVARWVCSLAGALWVLATAWSMLAMPLARPLTLRRMARVLETRHPELQERISSALELVAQGGNAAQKASAELVALLEQDARQDLAGVRPRHEFRLAAVRPFLIAALALLCGFGVIFAIWPQQGWLLLLRALAPHREFDTLEASALRVEPRDIALLTGAPLHFKVVAPARHGARAEIYFFRKDGRMVTERLTRHSATDARQELYTLTIPAVEESFNYRVKYGGAYTRPYSVIVLTPPEVVATRASYTYPDYTGMAPTQVVGVAQTLAGVAGTRVTIENHFNRQCRAALLWNRLSLLQPGGATNVAIWSQSLTTNHTGRWAIQLYDVHSFSNNLTWAACTVLPDQPPEVTLLQPLPDKLVLPPFDTLTCLGAAHDDFGLGEMLMVLRSVDGSSELLLPVTVSAPKGDTLPEAAPLLRAELCVAPDLQQLYNSGMRHFKLTMRASDKRTAPYGGAQTCESRAITITLKPDAPTLRAQTRDHARKEIEKILRQSHSDLHKAANLTSSQAGELSKPEMPVKALDTLQEAREKAHEARQQISSAARLAENSTFQKLTEQLLDARDERLEPALRKLEQIPLTATEQRRSMVEEVAKELREAAGKIAELAGGQLSEENQRLAREQKMAEAAQQEAALARQAAREAMLNKSKQEWVAAQNTVEQKMWQGKESIPDAHFQEALDELRQARDAMQQALRATTPEDEKRLTAAQSARKLAESANQEAAAAAQSALTAAQKAQEAITTRAPADALRQAAEELQQAAAQAQAAAAAAGQIAHERMERERVLGLREQLATAQRAVDEARVARDAAHHAYHSAEKAQHAAAALETAQPEQSAQNAQESQQHAHHARQQAQRAGADARETARQAAEQGLAQSAEAARLTAEAATTTARAAELALESTRNKQPTDGADNQEAHTNARQAREVATEAVAKASAAHERAQKALQELQRAAQAAREDMPTIEALRAKAREVTQQSAAATQAAHAADKSIAELATESAAATPTQRMLAERLGEAALMTEQAGAMAQQAGERSAAAESDNHAQRAPQVGQQAQAEAERAQELAREAGRLANEVAQMAAREPRELRESSQASAQAASQGAEAATQSAQKGEEQARAFGSAEMMRSAQQSGAAAKLAGEAAQLVRQALRESEQSSAAADRTAHGQARTAETQARAALELARRGMQPRDDQSTTPGKEQREAAQRAQQAAQNLSSALANRTERTAEAEALIQRRLGEVEERVQGRGATHANAMHERVQANLDWARLRGRMDSAAYEEMLRQTPLEYRDLVKRYFEEVAREGQ